ncbi:MAG: hypothetical protein EA402_13550 [Planctomycetota bacterium]|nr:MAG: hypothetical protein EA402_13550 [Planctomycetota bacterium]
MTTSDGDIQSLRSLLLRSGVPDDPASGVIFAGTPLTGARTYNLGGILNADGRAQRGNSLAPLQSWKPEQFGKHPISSEGITDVEAKRAWWYLTTGNYAAVAPLAQVARGRGEVAEQAQLLLERVEQHLIERFEKLSLPIANIATHDAAQRLFDHMQASGIRNLAQQQRTLTTELRNAARNPDLADELRARTAFFRLQELTIARNARERDQARDGFSQLASTLPNTKWGKRAVARLEVLSAQ